MRSLPELPRPGPAPHACDARARAEPTERAGPALRAAGGRPASRTSCSNCARAAGPRGRLRRRLGPGHARRAARTLAAEAESLAAAAGRPGARERPAVGAGARARSTGAAADLERAGRARGRASSRTSSSRCAARRSPRRSSGSELRRQRDRADRRALARALALRPDNEPVDRAAHRRTDHAAVLEASGPRSTAPRVTLVADPALAARRRRRRPAAPPRIDARISPALERGSQAS